MLAWPFIYYHSSSVWLSRLLKLGIRTQIKFTRLIAMISAVFIGYLINYYSIPWKHYNQGLLQYMTYRGEIMSAMLLLIKN